MDLGATEIVEFAKRQDHFAIYQEDQLRKDKDRKKIFVGFGELTLAWEKIKGRDVTFCCVMFSVYFNCVVMKCCCWVHSVNCCCL